MGSVGIMNQRGENLYQRVSTAIAAAIDERRCPVGTRLPGEREAVIALALRGPVARLLRV